MCGLWLGRTSPPVIAAVRTAGSYRSRIALVSSAGHQAEVDGQGDAGDRRRSVAGQEDRRVRNFVALDESLDGLLHEEHLSRTLLVDGVPLHDLVQLSKRHLGRH